MKDIFAYAMEHTGQQVSTDICEHFAHTRQELYDIVRVSITVTCPIFCVK